MSWFNLKAVGSTLLPIGCGMLNGFFFSPRKNDRTNDWYNKRMIKPSFNPPGWVFGPVWTTLYGMMGYSAYRILALHGSHDITRAMTAFGVQFALNMSWTPVFFGLHQIELASVIVSGMCASTLWTIKEFACLDTLASRLLYPYMAWISFALVLNFSILYLNRNNKSLKEQ